MSMSLQILAAAALVPAMVGPQPAPQGGAGVIVLALCNGGSITVPVDQTPPASGTQPCCAKGCHSAERKRKQADKADEEV